MKRGLKDLITYHFTSPPPPRLNEKRIERSLQAISKLFPWSLNEKRIESLGCVVGTLPPKSFASMKRGLKDEEEHWSDSDKDHGLNEKRIESRDNRDGCAWLSDRPQWKEDWKHEEDPPKAPRGNLPQWKEDWKLSLSTISTSLNPQASMKRGLKVYLLHFHSPTLKK